jgi:hypothetical protein
MISLKKRRVLVFSAKRYEYENEEGRKYSERSLALIPYLKGIGWAKLFGQQCAVFLAEYLVSYRC